MPIVAVNGIYPGGTVISCLRGNRCSRYRVGGIRDHGCAFYRVKDNTSKGRAWGD